MISNPTRVSSLKESVEGWAQDVDEKGNLVLRLADGSLRSFNAGEVSLRPPGAGMFLEGSGLPAEGKIRKDS